ncbi:MAG: ABC transporter ATP-binding protein [Blastocatellia bacterium]|nr:ABC transporter ATP-binding protein [Blastocatellia bacterium]
MLQVREINFSYAEPVLKDISFDVSGGELLAVIGPNGSGKSTLLKIIIRALSPASGAVSLDGRNIASLSRRDVARLMGYVAQQSTVRFPLTAMEFVLQGRFAQGRMVGFESETDVRQAAWAMEVTETSEFACRLIGELSGGERQRAVLARAIASRPRLLVLDEPVANLDISHQVKMLDLVKRLTAEGEMSALVVTHELNLAAEFATHVLMLKSGEMRGFGSPGEVLTESRLSDLFDADLLVDVNPVSGAPRITLTAKKRERGSGGAGERGSRGAGEP